LAAVAILSNRWHWPGMMALMPVSSAMASDQPVLMVLGDSLVAGHGLPQDEAFPDVLGRC
jgi:hypothetical protein